MATTTIPTQIIDFNIYNAPNKLIGAGDEVTLPKIVSKTYTAALQEAILICRFTTENNGNGSTV